MNEVDCLYQRIAVLEQTLKEKDVLIERLVQDQHLFGGSGSSPPCIQCTQLKERWRKIHAHFQEVPRLLDAMIERTDRIFEHN
jgi:hypothetical protein